MRRDRLGPVRMASLHVLLGLGAVPALLGCSDGEEEAPTQAIAIEFEARFGAQPFACDAPLTGLGMSAATVHPLDLRLFVHDVALIRADGGEEPLVLEEDGLWQREGLALLDFEDATGTCNTGSPETNTVLRGTAAGDADYIGLAFTLGVPSSKNHLDAATAPAPLNAPGMWWSWQGGYKYAKIDLASTANPEGYYFHLGGTTCEGSLTAGFECRYPNLARIELTGSRPGRVVFDASALYREVDLERTPDLESDFLAGCMAFAGDPECPPMFGAFALGFEDRPATAATQTAFSLEADDEP